MEAQLMGQRLRQAREKRGMSQIELAELVNHSQKDISNYETGKSLIKVTELPLFSQALQVTISYFFTGEANSTKDTAIIQELIDQIDNPLDRDALIDIIRIFSQTISRK